ncbi:Uncharacterised protein [Klebsiella quasipneumoniae]|uniref:Uncharacterized protein n=1 Tax=Klebsiella quasipneumoniae TaxID=1463165 RepID=A0ABD7N1H7_9ENTR|nr:Uncharacterised protein [Klebsiella quasipneumoniae]
MQLLRQRHRKSQQKLLSKIHLFRPLPHPNRQRQPQVQLHRPKSTRMMPLNMH